MRKPPATATPIRLPLPRQSPTLPFSATDPSKSRTQAWAPRSRCRGTLPSRCPRPCDGRRGCGRPAGAAPAGRPRSRALGARCTGGYFGSVGDAPPGIRQPGQGGDSTSDSVMVAILLVGISYSSSLGASSLEITCTRHGFSKRQRCPVRSRSPRITTGVFSL